MISAKSTDRDVDIFRSSSAASGVSSPLGEIFFWRRDVLVFVGKDDESPAPWALCLVRSGDAGLCLGRPLLLLFGVTSLCEMMALPEGDMTSVEVEMV